jgi:crotonobetainyl-CoA:carnitine CoA-transferase CaiB-like acyl-CoA transferase
MPETKALPLAGIRVLEFCHTIMGPTAGVVLADMGADVIKVEPAPAGDKTRRLPGFASGFFVSFNRNKRGIALDLKSEAGRAVAHRLIGQADMLFENYGPGTMERLGCGYDQVKHLNEGLIYGALKGFLSGPYEHRPALDEVVQFMGGLAYMTGPPGQPVRAGTSVIDMMGGTIAVVGALAALEERRRTGKGQYLKSALFESTAWLMTQHMAGEVITGKEMPPMPAREGAWAVYELFETADGDQVFIGLTSDNHWRRFCTEFGREDLLSDPDYASNEARVKMRPSLLPLVASLVKPHTMAEVVEIAERIGIPFAPVARTKHLHDDPHLNAGRGMLAVDMPTGGQAKLPRLPIEMGDHELGLTRQPPTVGEHTREVMLEAGYSAAEIEGLAAEGAVVLG